MAGPDRASHASLGRRLAAYLLDIAVAISVVLLVGSIIRILQAVGAWVPAGVAGVSPEELWKAQGSIANLFVIFAFILSTGPVYFALCHASPWQATFGKRLLNIYVTDDTGSRISMSRSLGRWVALFIFNSLGGGLISLITIAATEKRKGLHDFVARTQVLRGRPVPGGALEPRRIAVALGFPFVWTLGTFLAIL